jgi:hypothetical protein
VPSAVDPNVDVAYGTWDFPTGGSCGPENALRDLPSSGAFVWIDEYADPDNNGDFEGLYPNFSIDLQTPPARWQCAAAAPSRMYLVKLSGRYFEIHAAFGPAATDATVQAAADLISSLDVSAGV